MSVAVILLAASNAGYADEEIYNAELPQAVVQQVEEAFAEYETPEAALLAQDANLEIKGDTTISLTFVGEGAGFKNSVGVFTYDENHEILEQETVFANFSGTGPGLAGGGDLLPGDTVDVGPFLDGDQVGFFVIANGYHNASGKTYRTLADLNPDGHDHDAVVEIEGAGTLIGFEDLWNLGDADYNDALLMVSTHIMPQDSPGLVMESAAQHVAEPVAEAVAQPIAESVPERDADPDEAERNAEREAELVAQVAHILEIPSASADQLIRKHGFGAIEEAIRRSSGDPSKFSANLYGYDVGHGPGSSAGGGGSVSAPLASYSECEESFQATFQLFSPVTGLEVASAVVSLTVVRASSNMILGVYRVPYDINAGSYFLSLDTSGMSSGWYDLYLGLDDRHSYLVRVELP